MWKGSCCCGAVQFEVTEKPSMLGTCHCSRCRKVGASHLAFVKAKAFTLTQGRESISVFKAEPPFQYDRCFCSKCGTSLGEVLSDSESFPISADCLDSELDLEVAFHEFVAEKPSWLKIGGTGKQFPGHPG